MKVLIVGNGGREHALAWKINQSPHVTEILCAPGNPNFREAKQLQLKGNEELADFAAANAVDLTIVGPEAPLCEGLVDVFRRRGLAVFGPDAVAARLEGSKAFARDFMRRHHIPSPTYRVCDSRSMVERAITEFGIPVVIKADGLAGGKGVTVAKSRSEAENAIDECLRGGFGESGKTVVVEECLEGEEASILALVDNNTILPLASSQDHKPLGEGDTGPNTGGMGAYSPAPVVTAEVWQRVQEQVLDRFLHGCRQEGLDYRGVIYAGIMVVKGEPKVLEFNVRFGDPETQAVLPRLRSDLPTALLATVENRLDEISLAWDKRAAVCVVMASEGYPGHYEKGYPISGIEKAEQQGAVVFHAGTDRKDERTVTAGGRVVGVTCMGDDVKNAVDNVYQAVECITWQGAYYRRDIARRAC